ncbi:hypothetical protein OPQ81_007818 [Rhizoctonia solani]|nr:hypothetical protein OPQ81_007818 [Rhizoctonia solani]
MLGSPGWDMPPVRMLVQRGLERWVRFTLSGQTKALGIAGRRRNFRQEYSGSVGISLKWGLLIALIDKEDKFQAWIRKWHLVAISEQGMRCGSVYREVGGDENERTRWYRRTRNKKNEIYEEDNRNKYQ